MPIDTSGPTPRPDRHRVSPTLIAVVMGGIAAVVVVAILLFTAAPPEPSSDPLGRNPKRSNASATRPVRTRNAKTRRGATATTGSGQSVVGGPSREETVPDDGQTLWASPTSGPPLSLRYLPIGTQIFVALRPVDLAGHPDGEKVIESLGPAAASWRQRIEQLSGFPFAGIDQLIFGLRVTPAKQTEVSLVLRPHTPIDLAELASRHAQAVTTKQAAVTYLVSGPWSFYLPPGEAGRAVVIAKTAAMREIIESAAAPPLRPAMERLLAMTDASRTLTLLGPPNYLLTDAASLLAGPAGRLHEPLDWLLKDPIEALSLSVHLDRNLFLELRAVGPLDRPPAELAERLHDRLEQVPDQVESYLVGLNPPPYGRRILGRFPQMLQILTNYIRTGTEGDQAVLRCYLPAIAAHNLLMGFDLALCAGASPAPATASPPAHPATLQDRLARQTTLRFDRDTLEHAVELLANEIGVAITILGSDLQLEGITKNQSFGIDVQDQPAETVLQRIVLLANPDKTVKKLSDPQQTLVYVIRPARPGQAGTIVVTTRKQAAARGEKLPEAFGK